MERSNSTLRRFYRPGSSGESAKRRRRPQRRAPELTCPIYRALLAGGFGRAGEFTHNDRPVEIAAVVPTHTDAIGHDPHFTRRFPPSPAPGRAGSLGSGDKKELDIEEAGSSEVPESLSKHWDASVEHGPIGELIIDIPLADLSLICSCAVSTLTRRFHVDLQSAVNAAAGTDDW